MLRGQASSTMRRVSPLLPVRRLLAPHLPRRCTAAAPVARPCTARRCSTSPRSASGWEDTSSSSFTLPQVHLAYDTKKLEQLLQTHVIGAMAVGMDIEWKPVGRFYGGDGRPALLQIATPRAVVLVPLKHLPSKPPSLRSLLHRKPLLGGAAGAAPSAPFMCGVGVDSDLDMLLNEQRKPAPQPRPPGVGQAVDIGAAAARTGLFPFALDRQVGLAALVSALGGPQLQKPKSVQMSDWSKRHLTDAQVEYAALDAYAGGWAAARLHAHIVLAAASNTSGSGSDAAQHSPVPPFLEWLSVEAELQEAHAARRAKLRQMLDDAALRRVRQGMPGWVSWDEVAAEMQAEVPEASANKLRNHIKRLVKKEWLVASEPVGVDGEELPQRLQLGKRSTQGQAYDLPLHSEQSAASGSDGSCYTYLGL